MDMSFVRPLFNKPLYIFKFIHVYILLYTDGKNTYFFLFFFFWSFLGPQLWHMEVSISLTPLSEARGRTCNLTVPSQIRFCCTPKYIYIFFMFQEYAFFLDAPRSCAQVDMSSMTKRTYLEVVRPPSRVPGLRCVRCHPWALNLTSSALKHPSEK